MRETPRVGGIRNVVGARDYMHAYYTPRGRKSVKMRRTSFARAAHLASRNTYYLVVGVGIIASWAATEPQMGTGCFALEETNNKSRKLNRRYRLSMARRRARYFSRCISVHPHRSFVMNKYRSMYDDPAKLFF